MPIPKLKAPIVLVHGFCGFDRFTVGGLPIAQYFPGIPALLEKAGNKVLVPWLSATRGVADRARELKKFLDEHFPGEGVHLIAHSMGGLDSRYMISRLGMEKRILTLTTLGTPHRGTSFADWGISNLGRIVKPMLELFNIPTQAFYDLTNANCQKFNEENPNSSDVRYFSVAGEYRGEPFKPEWLLSYNIVYDSEGPNDGVVSVESATWGERIAIRDCDHLELVCWNNGLWPAGPITDKGGELYALVMERLKDEGY